MKKVWVIKSFSMDFINSLDKVEIPKGIYEVRELEGICRSTMFFYLTRGNHSIGPFRDVDWEGCFAEGYLELAVTDGSNVFPFR